MFREIPKSALCFNVGECEFGNNGNNATTAPFKMVARSGNPINHFFWGKVVHDMSGLKLNKPRITIDYNHNPNEVLGWANKFDIASGDLVANGTIQSTKANDRANEVITRGKAGQPYEASIFFDDDVVCEEVPEGATAFVNGRTVEGQALIIRQWSLRGIAVCPYGADANTSTQFKETDTVKVRFISNNAFAFQHNSKLAKNEPKWTDVDKETLPRPAFADKGDADKVSTWKYPHHWIQNGNDPDKEGRYQKGTMFLHKGGLDAAWSAANGAESGEKASQAVIDHLEEHRKALAKETDNKEEKKMTDTVEAVQTTAVEASKTELGDQVVPEQEQASVDTPEVEAAVSVTVVVDAVASVDADDDEDEDEQDEVEADNTPAVEPSNAQEELVVQPVTHATEMSIDANKFALLETENKELKAENEKLNARLKALAASGETKPVAFQAVPEVEKAPYDAATYNKLTKSGCNPALAAYAASLKLPQR